MTARTERDRRVLLAALIVMYVLWAALVAWLGVR